eukprot:5995244-Pleurochrysis_carterae.AAC.1
MNSFRGLARTGGQHGVAGEEAGRADGLRPAAAAGGDAGGHYRPPCRGRLLIRLFRTRGHHQGIPRNALHGCLGPDASGYCDLDSIDHALMSAGLSSRGYLWICPCPTLSIAARYATWVPTVVVYEDQFLPTAARVLEHGEALLCMHSTPGCDIVFCACDSKTKETTESLAPYDREIQIVCSSSETDELRHARIEQVPFAEEAWGMATRARRLGRPSTDNFVSAL